MELNRIWDMYEESVTKEVKLRHKEEVEPNPFNNLDYCEQNGITNGILRCLEELEVNKNEVWNKSFDIYCKAYGVNINTGFGFWVPCDERLPNKKSSVLVTLDDGFVASVDYTDDWELWADSGDVVAWMPLPEPYEGK